MKIKDLIEQLDLKVFTQNGDTDREIAGGYTSDLLSDVMGHVDEGMVWITIQTHPNILAVASLKELAAVLIVNGTVPGEETVEKGNSEEILLLGTSLSAFEISGKIYRLLQGV